MATPQLSDERLAWLAVRDQLNKQSQPNALLHFLLRIGRARTAGRSAYSSRGPVGEVNQADDFSSRKMRVYAIAVDELSRRLTREDRLVLRSTGKVPEWFMPTVILEARNIRLD